MLFQLKNGNQIIGHEYGFNKRDAALKSVRRTGASGVKHFGNGVFQGTNAQGQECATFSVAKINDEPLPLR